MRLAGRRWILGGLGILVALVGVAAAALLTDTWRPGGTTVEIVDTAPALFAQTDLGRGIMVCAPPNAWPGGDDERATAILLIAPSTAVQDRRGRLLAQPASFADLRPGQRLSVWETGGVLLSDPVQVVVEQVVIEEEGPGGPAPCPLNRLEP